MASSSPSPHPRCTPPRSPSGARHTQTDGGVFSFGAPFLGSTGALHLAGMQVDAGSSGYRFVASDGGIFCYDAPFFGSLGGHALNKPVIAMAGR